MAFEPHATYSSNSNNACTRSKLCLQPATVLQLGKLVDADVSSFSGCVGGIGRGISRWQPGWMRAAVHLLGASFDHLPLLVGRHHGLLLGDVAFSQ